MGGVGRRGVADTSEPRASVLFRSWRCEFVSRARLVALLSVASFQGFLEHASSRAFTRNAAIETSAFRQSARIILALQEQPWKLPIFLLALTCQMDENRDLSQRNRGRES